MQILLPVDGSRHAAAAVELIARRALHMERDTTVVLLNVQRRVTAEVERLVGTERLRQIRDKDAHEALKPALARLHEGGVQVSLEIRDGNPGEEIAALARRRRVDLIAMGARGLSEFDGLFLGSETMKVLAACDTPVLVVRKPTGAGPETALKVGIALDGSDYGIAAVRYALDHVGLFGPQARFTLIHVVADFGAPIAADIATPVAMYSTDEIQKVQARQYEQAVSPARAMFGARGMRCDEVMLAGAPGEEIARHARERGLDLIVMGSHGHGRFLSAVMGSVALRLAARCDLPLLLIRRP